MPLDPRIPLGVQAPQIANPLDLLQQVTQLQGLREQRDARQADAAEKAAARQRATELQQVWQRAVTIGPDGQPVIDWPTLLPHVPPDKLFDIKNAADENSKRMAEAQTAKLTAAEKKATYLGGLAGVVRAADDDQQAFDLATTLAQAAGALTPAETEQTLAFSRDPAFRRQTVDQLLAMAGPPKEGPLERVTTTQDGQEGTLFTQAKPGDFFPSAPKPASASEHSPIYREWQDYKGEGGTLDFNAYQTADANRRATHVSVTTPSGQRPLTQTAEATLISRLNTQWTTANKPQRELAQQVATMRGGLAAAERGDMAQGTEAVLQPFLKILDLNSVVREGEFFRLREGQSYIARAQGIMQRLTKGGFVPLAELKKYAALAEEIGKRQDAYVAGVRGRIGEVAKRYSIPEDLVFESAAPETPASTPGGGPGLSYQDYLNSRKK